MTFTQGIDPLETNNAVFCLAYELSVQASTMAKERELTPGQARLALELASRVSVAKKIAPAVMAQNLADAITDLRSLQPYNYHVEEALEKLIAAADAIVDEL
ncbi:TPA: hypothetical protein ACHJRJ_000923 [Escherichia coli]